MDKRSRNKHRRYEQALFAAEKLFSENRWEDVQMKDIAEEAGIGIATLFRYFPKKQTLLVAVAVMIMSRELQFVEETVTSDQFALQKLETILDRLGEVVTNPNQRTRRFIDLFEGYIGNSTETLEGIDTYLDIRARIAEAIGELTEEGVQDGSFDQRKVSTEECLTLINSFALFARKLAMTGILHQPDGRLSPRAQLETIKTIYLNHVRLE
ncbi:TetR/AcrR family transcriptional regulator [Salisediminibacterium selenitireducens]|uniref:Transcriptional regulator, TetR family n=1 Tax=Bacillus selenitireducens (strain ATCC 700615 / DSM 15326 / MLS10) TaxID=439292 RepID=D6XY84_BACIE|nr:TetR/AcrR family transcriptional regulator [Salisediminibacterium selenitireducens]ADH98157.1 transcriptional regulator, TetR family [[Bacillus] selenitireducens MLS10]